MSCTRDRTDESALQGWQRRRARLECRECEVICERVVSPWHCLRSHCQFVYAYEDGDTTYFGCLHKVFLPELDLAAFAAERVGGARRQDPYGHLRVVRTPLPQCRVTVEQAYEALYSPGGCCNPTFFHHPAGPEEDKIRLTANVAPRRGETQGSTDSEDGSAD